MAAKQSRWYEIANGMAFVYDHPHKEKSQSVSVIKPEDLGYYRRTFRLEKIWDKN
jgi:hypothetical protein